MSGLKQRRGGGSTDVRTPSISASPEKPVIVIAGGGPAGAAIAKSLADRGIYQVKLLEGYPHPDQIDKNTSKSYVIALGGRGQRSLQAATGISPQQIQNSILSHNLARHPGKHVMSIKDHPSLLVPRQSLTAQLLNEAGAAGVEIHFQHKLTDIDFEQRIAEFEAPTTSATAGGHTTVVRVRYDLLIGADGSKSQVRSLLDQHADDFHVTRLERDSMEYQVVVIDTNPFLDTHPADATHAWNDKTLDSICLAFPLSTGKLLLAIVFPEGRLAEFRTTGGYDEALDKLLPDVDAEVKKTIIEQLSAGTPANGGTCVWTSSMGSVKHGVVLVGDSAHGMWPSLGQGCNCALESVAVFCKTMDDLASFTLNSSSSVTDSGTTLTSWAEMVVQEFHQRRHADACAAVDLTYGGIGARKSRGRQNAPLSFKMQVAGMMLLHKLSVGFVPRPALLRVMAGDDVPYSTAKNFNFYYEKMLCVGALAVSTVLVYWIKQRS